MSKLKVTIIKKGRRTDGGIYTLSNGTKVYLAHRKVSDIYRAGKPTISEAIREGVAAWAFYEEICLKMRAEGVAYMGVLVKETGDRFLTALANLFDSKQVKVMDHNGRAALQRYLPLQAFQRRPGKITKRR